MKNYLKQEWNLDISWVSLAIYAALREKKNIRRKNLEENFCFLNAGPTSWKKWKVKGTDGSLSDQGRMKGDSRIES